MTLAPAPPQGVGDKMTTPAEPGLWFAPGEGVFVFPVLVLAGVGLVGPAGTRQVMLPFPPSVSLLRVKKHSWRSLLGFLVCFFFSTPVGCAGLV